MAVVGELLLSAFLNMLFGRLSSPEFLNFVRNLGGGVESELIKWKHTLTMIEALLSDAEEKQLTDRAVKVWLDNLRDLAYDAEDILDEFATKALENKLMADQPSTSKVKYLIPDPAACFNCFSSFNFSRRSKIKSISTRLEELYQTRIQLGLQTSVAAQSRQRQANDTSSVPEELAFYGRYEDKAKVLQMVLSDGPTDEANFHVISIIGTAGVGKTKLAQEVYNDRAVGIFDIKAWVCVSDDFDVLSISKAFLEKITSKPCHLVDMNEVQVQLKKAVAGKRFLLVLDDVWNEKYNLWTALKAPFKDAAPRSKMIVTTRNSPVALTMGAIEHYNLKPLSNDHCWSIFKLHAYERRDINAYPISKSLREKVVAKCGGLPLAAKTLGGLLRSKRDDEWDEILSSNILDLPESGILPVLRLSYHYLPSHLKRCFAYCAIFPKDYEIEEKELVFLWMAEGIIQQSGNNKKQPEALGRGYFLDLLSRSILQRSSSNNSKFVMHDLVHDLAQWVSGETSFRWEGADKIITSVQKARHCSYIYSRRKDGCNFEILHEVQHHRTFLPLTISSFEGDDHQITDLVISDLLPKFVKLRVLSLSKCYISVFPNRSISGLKHLRYLNFSYTMIKKIPESTCSLINLQILLLRDCSYLSTLPSNMRKLINLRHLDITGAYEIKEMPLGMKELKNLQALSNFIVGRGTRSSGLEALKNLTFLGGELCISGLENVNDPCEAREAALCKKQNLEVLSLKWKFQVLRNEVVQEHVLDMLKPCTNIKQVKISRYGGERFPSWIGDPSFSKIEVLKLKNCIHCTSLRSLGLLRSLKDLTVKRMINLKSIDAEVYGVDCTNPFQSLETLRLEDLPKWEYWVTKLDGNGGVAGFPSLRELSIVNCPKFSGKMPEQYLPSLKKHQKSTTLKCLPDEIVGNNSQLERLCVRYCDSLTFIGRCMLPSSLKRLEIENCKNLQQLVNGEEDVSSSSPSSSSSSMMLKRLRIWKCPELTSISLGIQFLEALEDLDIFSCGKLESIPYDHLHNLKIFTIFSCEKLEALPHDMHKFNSLRFLSIEHCPSIVSFPKEGFPINLTTLSIGDDVKMYKALTHWGLHRLTSLQSLSISGCHEAECFPDEMVMLLPSSLTHLFLERLPKLKYLSSMGFQNLTSLEYLRIEDCPNLTSFPEVGLPSTLLRLIIFKCPKLKKECKRDTGKEWSKIANIPRVEI